MMISYVEMLLSIGVVILLPLTAALLFIAIRSKKQLTSDEALESLKENWSKLKATVILGSLALFIFLGTELIEILETIFVMPLNFLPHIISRHKLGEVLIVYLLILVIAVNYYFAHKIKGGMKSEHA